MPSPGRRDRPGPRPGEGEPIADRVHHSPGPRRRVLADPPCPQASPAPSPYPDRSGRPRRRAGDHLDAHEQYPYRFPTQAARTVRRALPCGDYGIDVDGRLVASVERKSLADLVSSLTGGKLHYALAELAALPRATLVVEDRYSRLYKIDWVRPAVVADGLAEFQVRWPNVPIVFCETRQLAEERTYRYLAAAHTWALNDAAARERIGAGHPDETEDAPPAPEPSTAEVRAWAPANAIPVPDRGRLRPEIWEAWRTAAGQ
ncbi:MAG TPA: ERCC4 domain-containing protein [Acidimicrobiales bacterium]